MYLEPISLGYSCDVKYQLSRNLYFRWFPTHSETQFRNMLFRWLQQPTRFRRNIFDWMIAPFSAVCAYLENDFQGVFERGDLELHDDGRKVRHRDLLTIHPHDFKPGPDGRYTDALIDEQYPAARAKFDYLAARFRRHLQTPGPYLYVFKEIRALQDIERLRDLLGARNEAHLFQLLLVDNRGAVNQVLNALRGQAVKGWLPGGCDKAPDRKWEGDDAAWDAILGRFALDVHADGGARHAGPPPWAVLPPPPIYDLAHPPREGWRTMIEADGPEQFSKIFDYVDPTRANASLTSENGRLVLESPSADAHFFCHFQPVAVLGDGGWVRLRMTWPDQCPVGERMLVSLQDQDCRNYRLAHEEQDRKALSWGRVPADIDGLRLVFTPTTAGRSSPPLSVGLDLHRDAIVPESDLIRQDEIPVEFHMPTGPSGSAAANPWWRRLGAAIARNALSGRQR
jgi:hypothetical protein